MDIWWNTAFDSMVLQFKRIRVEKEDQADNCRIQTPSRYPFTLCFIQELLNSVSFFKTDEPLSNLKNYHEFSPISSTRIPVNSHEL